MRAVVRSMIDRARRLTGKGAVRNAYLEVEDTSRSVIEIDRRLKQVCDPSPRRAA